MSASDPTGPTRPVAFALEAAAASVALLVATLFTGLTPLEAVFTGVVGATLGNAIYYGAAGLADARGWA